MIGAHADSEAPGTAAPLASWTSLVILRLLRIRPFSGAARASVREAVPFSNSQYRLVGLISAWSNRVGISE